MPSRKKTRVPPKTKSTQFFLSRTETRKRERGSRRQTRKVMHVNAAQSQTFVDLCNHYIMNTSLEFVRYKSWLSKNKVNIFIIGEVHSYRNYTETETGIFEMFEQLKQAIKDEDTSIVDIMVETSEGYTNREEGFWMTPEKFPRADYKQINNVRGLFHTCIANHNCGKIRSHWVDNVNFSISTTYKKTNTFALSKIPGLASAPASWYAPLPSVRTALATMPPWLRTFYDDYERYDESFQAKFQTDEDLFKLLDENTIVIKEINKAARVQRDKREEPIFDVDFARVTLAELSQLWLVTDAEYMDLFGYKGKIYNTARAVMDIYTVARIIKSNMKNVIIYEGGFHAENVVYILTKLGYTTNAIIRRDVGLPLDTPVPLPVPDTVPIEDTVLTDE